MPSESKIAIPPEFICPISQTIMKDPYVDSDGNSYEKAEISQWLQRRQESPITRRPMTMQELIPNRSLKGLIESFVETYPEVLGDVALPRPAASLAAESSALDREPLALFAVIDNSGSMGTSCGGKQAEADEFSRLDLVKHTLNTMISSLSDFDRICIIKFSTTGEIFSPLTYCTDSNKAHLMEQLKRLDTEGQTNIWDGMRVALDQMATLPADGLNIQIYLLTDGEPTINPPQPLPITIENYMRRKCPEHRPVVNTFGYGYNLNSELIYTVASSGGGSFGYIPDSSMVGTVFINALSNSLTRKVPKKPENRLVSETIDELLESLHTIFSNPDNDHGVVTRNLQRKLEEMIANPDNASNTTGVEFLKQLLFDVTPSPDPNIGQISKAAEAEFIHNWGMHYLRSVASAYENQVCINFKDKGMQYFCSKRFTSEQERIEDIFVQLPPPKPSNRRNNYSYAQQSASFSGVPTPAPVASMSRFYDTHGGCFTSDSLVFSATVSTGNNNTSSVGPAVPVSSLKKGSLIMSDSGPTTVEAIVALKYHGPLYKVSSGMTLTSYHPVMIDNVAHFPCELVSAEKVDDFDGFVYDLVLANRGIIASPFFTDANEQVPFYVASFGHNCKKDKFIHEYFGSDSIVNDLRKHPSYSMNGELTLTEPRFIRRNDGQVVQLLF